jgi:hypothetical protein
MGSSHLSRIDGFFISSFKTIAVDEIEKFDRVRVPN